MINATVIQLERNSKAISKRYYFKTVIIIECKTETVLITEGVRALTKMMKEKTLVNTLDFGG